MINYKEEFWETGQSQADKEIVDILDKLFSNKISLRESMYFYTQLEDKYPTYFAKETDNKFIDHILFNTEYTENEVVDLFQYFKY